MKNNFYFMLKALFLCQIFIFCADFLVMYKNDLIMKLRLILKFMMPQAGKQILTIHILLNISRERRNQAMKFGQLIEYDMRNIFLTK